MKVVKVTYPEFLVIKSHGYSISILKYFACKYLGCAVDDIDDIDFYFKLTFDVYLKDEEVYNENKEKK